MFQGPLECTPGWICTVASVFYSTCVAVPGTVTPENPTPDLAVPGSFCKPPSSITVFYHKLMVAVGGSSAIARGYPSVCVPGYSCSGPGVYGYFVCLLDQASSSSSITLPATSLVISTTSSDATTLATTTKASATKSTTTKSTTSTKTLSPTKAVTSVL